MLTKERIIFLALGSFFAVLAIWVMATVLTAPPRSPDAENGIACTMEAKLCPDGSSVGRIGPNCEFAACPGEVPVPAPSIPRGKPIPMPISPTPIDEGGGSTGGTVACTMDAKMCPDGSYVGRTAPNCEFAPCPVSASPSGNTDGSCMSNSDCAKGYSCIDTSPVVREGTQNLRCWKDGTPTPICLSGETRIATPAGDMLVKNIRAGDTVWSVDGSGKRIEAPVRISSYTNAPANHRVVHLVLDDGRELFASPGHSIADGRTLGSLLVGDIISGSVVTAADLVTYDESYTYDILPESASATYWANGILLRSTFGN